MNIIKKESIKVDTIIPKQDLRFFDQEELDKSFFLRSKKFWIEFKNRIHNFGIQRFSLMFTPHIGSKGFTIHVSNYLLLFIGIVSSVALLSVTYILAQGHQSTRNQVRLVVENDALEEKIFLVSETVESLSEYFSKFRLEVATRARITSRFGLRRNPFDQRGIEGHEGLDLATLPGTPVYAGADGVVTKAGVQGGYGNLIEIQHKYEFKTRYGHLQGFAAQIYPGARVKQGQVIGYVGATGRVTGYHLHYEVLIGGGRVDPEPFAMMLR